MDEKEETITPENYLQLMYDAQKIFQERNGYSPKIHELASALMCESGELWSIAGGKWWKKYLDTIIYPHAWGEKILKKVYIDYYIKNIELKNRAKILEESIDILHFLLAVWINIDASIKEVYEAYRKKNTINQQRQDTNY